MSGDTLTLEGDKQSGEALIAPVMKGGKRVAPETALAVTREHAARELKRLPKALQQLERESYPVAVADALSALAAQADARARK
jgi:nicotinate phosphoribosyltransferase